MKKVFTLVLFVCLLVSCSNDSDDEIMTQCSVPTNIQFDSTTSESVVITWEDSNAAATYSLEYGVTGFMLGEGIVVTATEASKTLTGLDASTTYDVYVQSICPDNVSMQTTMSSVTTLAAFVVPQFLTNLSDLNLYSGAMEDITPSVYAFEYILATPLFTDNAHKQRLIALPPGTSMDYVDNGFPDFPDNTVISKTFYYNNDERDESLGKKIIETRLLIKQRGTWVLGNYKWNAAQTDAILDDSGSVVPVTYLDDAGETQNVDYEIPSATDCFTCHNNSSNVTPIGPKLRTLNISNQLQELIDQNLLSNLINTNVVSALPNWEDTANFSLEERTRAYFDINCAHCHSPGGNCYPTSNLDFRFETRFDDTNILEHAPSIVTRTQSLIPDYSMPLIGTTILHPEGYTMIEEYINSL